MKKLTGILVVAIVTIFYQNGHSQEREDNSKHEFTEVIKEDYELSKPTTNARAVLILFGGYPENAQDIKREFKILEAAKNNNIAVLFMNYNRTLWLEQNEKEQLAKTLQSIFEENELPKDNIYIGGFSSGGNVALQISDFIVEKDYSIIPKGVFIVDSPVDLSELYDNAEINVKRNFSEPSVQEGTWLIKTLGEKFGDPKKDISKYENYSVYTLRTGNIDNINDLKNTKIRLYTEPDTVWWKENRMADYEQMNAYPIKKLSETLHKHNFENVEYIPTENRGYRSNGQRHPHSWAIVDEKDLIEWILKE